MVLSVPLLLIAATDAYRVAERSVPVLDPTAILARRCVSLALAARL